jgi:hypothetical protein
MFFTSTPVDTTILKPRKKEPPLCVSTKTSNTLPEVFVLATPGPTHPHDANLPTGTCSRGTALHNS